MIEDIVLFTSIFHFSSLAGSLDDLKGFGSDLDFSCGRTNERTDRGVPRGPRGPKKYVRVTSVLRIIFSTL